MKIPRILFAAGGTGGHVYPALAIADAIRAAEPRSVIEFAGTRHRMEWEAVPRAGYAIHAIEAAGFDRRRPMANLGIPFTVARGAWQAWRLVADFDADVVVATGGFVTGPVGLAAALRRRPLVIQEQNAYAGVTNRWLSRFAHRIHAAFPEAASAFGGREVIISGNPVRSGIAGASRADGRQAFDLADDALVLLVIGGSLGSQALNEAVEQALPRWLEDPRVHVVWQTGPRYHDGLAHAAGDRVRVYRYIDRMDLAYAASDLVLSRAGASTCSELLASASPSVLVPSPNVAEDHQTHNARSLERAGAARLLPEPRLRDEIAALVGSLLHDEPARSAMRDAARANAPADVAERIARDVLDLAASRT